MKQKVLVVDDKADAREALQDSLAEAGYKVETATNGSDALQKIRSARGRFHFVLMDQFLPSKDDGLDATRLIHRKFPKVRVIMLTLYGDGDSSRKALEAGAYRYVFRPCPDQDIVTVMQAAEALRKLEEGLQKDSILRHVIENAGIGISVIDRTFHILYVNQELKRISKPGCRPGGICWVEYNEDLKGRKPCSWCPTKPALEHKTPHESVTFSEVEGDLRCFRVVACPILVGEIAVGVIEFVRDITEQYRADKAVDEANETRTRLKAVLARLCALGYSRSRLYELSEDGTALRGREQQGGTKVPISQVVLPLAADRYSRATLMGFGPQKFIKGQHGATLYDDLLDRADIHEWLDVPLLADGKPVGKITIDNKVIHPIPPGSRKPEPDPITQRHYPQIMLMAQFAAREIQIERERRRVSEESQRFRILHRLWGQFAEKGVLAEQMQAIVEAAKIAGVVGVHLRLLEENQLRLVAGIGPYFEAARTVRPMILLSDEKSGSARACRIKRLVSEPNVEHDAVLPDLSKSLEDCQARERLRAVKSFACFPILSEGEVLGVLGLQSDQLGFFGPSTCAAIEELVAVLASMLRIERLIGKLRSAEERLIHAARMAVHRIGNPNYAIQGRVTRWREHNESGKLTAELTRNVIEAIGEDSSRMAAILEDLKRFLKEPEIHLPVTPVDVNVIVRRAVEGETESKPDVHVEYHLDENLPKVMVDEQLFGEVFEELATNACKAMRNNGRLFVQTALAQKKELLERGLSEDQDFIRLIIEDSGPGVDPENKERIFEPFITTYADGTGMGLTFVRDVVQRMGGSVHECGVWHEGARFVILVPVQPNQKGDGYGKNTSC
ncbi:MAG: response regulator [Verrucomicrobiia bacterium]